MLCGGVYVGESGDDAEFVTGSFVTSSQELLNIQWWVYKYLYFHIIILGECIYFDVITCAENFSEITYSIKKKKNVLIKYYTCQWV